MQHMNSTMHNGIKMTILGSGTCVPSLLRSSCSLLAETGGRRIVFDMGPGVIHRLLQAGLEVWDVDFLFISHFHPDHTGSLVPFLFSNRYPDLTRRKNRLRLIGGPGFKAFFGKLAEAFNGWIELPGKLELIEADTATNDFWEHDFGQFKATAAKTSHRPESIGIRLESTGGATVVYSGDTEYCPQLVTLAKDADVLVCESSVPEECRVEGHMTPADAGKIAREAGVRHLVLTHFYPVCEKSDIEAQCRKEYNGPLFLATDLDCFHVMKGEALCPSTR